MDVSKGLALLDVCAVSCALVMHPDAGVFDWTVYWKLSNAIADAALHHVTVTSEVSNLTRPAQMIALAKTRSDDSSVYNS